MVRVSCVGVVHLPLWSVRANAVVAYPRLMTAARKEMPRSELKFRSMLMMTWAAPNTQIQTLLPTAAPLDGGYRS